MFMKIIYPFQHEEICGFKFGSSLYGRPSMYSISYFIDGLLIDTGHSRMRKKAIETFRQLAVNQVFITHHHEDHTGNLEAIQEQFRVPTYASAKCVEVMKKPPRISPAQWASWGPRPANFNLIAKDDFIKTPQHHFEIIPIPGHAVDMVALYEKERGWLFAADLWVYDYIRYFMESESMAQQIESLKRVLELDFEVLLCGHNPQFENGKERVRRKLAFLEDFYGRAAELYQEGYAEKEIFNQMGIKEKWEIRAMSLGHLSAVNMVRAVIRDEKNKII